MCKRRKESATGGRQSANNIYKREEISSFSLTSTTDGREKEETLSVPLTRISITRFPSIELSICALPIRATLEPSAGCCIHELEFSLLSYSLNSIPIVRLSTHSSIYQQCISLVD